MRRQQINSFFRDERAATTVEFVAIMGPFLLITFFIMEVVIAVLWIGTAEKAAQLGARLAVVSDLVVNPTSTICPAADAGGLITVNCLTASHTYGQLCSTGACAAYCTTPAKCTCTGTACNSANFTPIFDRMRAVFTLLNGHPEYVTIAYTNSGLGFAGGPAIPSVTVKLSSVPYGAVFITLLGNFFAAASSTSPTLANLPDISVTLTGEDLSSAGA